MCGIAAYIGDKPVDSVLIIGLTRLEYRGYDSAGIAVLDNGELVVRKEQGKIRQLDGMLQVYPVEGHLGIGHTRWATHGEPSRINAHPHTDGKRKIAVVHNGIIENHAQLRAKLQEKGCIFQSATDSEVIPHLAAELLSQGLSIEEAVRGITDRLEGRYAFVLLHESDEERLFFARFGSPLVYGRGKDESFLASDIAAMLPAAKEEYIIEDGQWGWIDRKQLHLFDFRGHSLQAPLSPIKLEVKDVEKSGYPHFMLKEIYEQPGMLRRILADRLQADGTLHFGELDLPLEYQNRLSRVLVTSAGTSWHAGLVGKYYLEHLARIQTEVDVSSEFRYRNPIAEGDTLVLAISQSGETADTIAGIHEAKAKFCRVLSLVNNANSTIARESTAYIDLLAGPEIGVASTKAYTAQLIHLLLYSLQLANLRWSLDREERHKITDELERLPEQIESILARADAIREIATHFREARDFIFLGRSYNFPTALEGALKLKEISYVHATGYAGGEFKHGPIALVSEEMPVVCIATRGDIYEKMLSNIEEVKARKGRIFTICTEGDEMVESMSEFSFAIPEVSDLLSPILAVVPLQLFAYYMALEKGCEPDQPRNLAKSVTVE